MKIIECPRDAMQGIEKFIPTGLKAEYINLLLLAGFDTIDFGSFVSPKAVPQMKDTKDVIKKLKVQNTTTHLLAIAANLRGAEDACAFDEIRYLGYPMSISETFQLRNTNKNIGESLSILQEIQDHCLKKGKDLVVYMSMGFGNPYGDPYDEDIVMKFADILSTLDIRVISLSDTIGAATTESITRLFSALSSNFKEIEWGCHLHSSPVTAIEKIEAAYLAGCRRFDGAIKGYGGCPMAKDELVGNLATEKILEVLEDFGKTQEINRDVFKQCLIKAKEVFN